MVKWAKSLLGQVIDVPKGLKGRCGHCKSNGLRYRLVTDGSERAEVEREEVFNGKYLHNTNRLAVNLPCPKCDNPVQFVLPR